MQPHSRRDVRLPSAGRRRRTALIGLAMIATWTLSSCGTGSKGTASERPAAARISHAIAGAISAGTADIAATVTSAPVGTASSPAGSLPSHVQYKGQGVVDFASSMAELTVAGVASTSRGACNNSYVVLTTGSALYVACAHPPASAGPQAAEWFCVPLTGASAPTNGLYSSFHALFDPSIWLGAVKASESSASFAGRSSIGGTVLARYDLALRSFAPPAPPAPAHASNRASALPQKAARATSSSAGPGGNHGTSTSTSTATVWLGPGGRLDMLGVKVTMPSPAAPVTGAASAASVKYIAYDITFAFSRFGLPPSLARPSSLVVLDPKGC